MTVMVGLTFNGQCKQAFDQYCELLGGQVESMNLFGETPAGSSVSADWQDKVIHATMSIGGLVIAGADIPADRYEGSQGFGMFADVESPEEAKRIFDELARGGSVKNPLGETFWARSYGSLVDRFGIPWEVNCSKGE